MFKRLAPFTPSDDLLTDLAETMIEDQAVPDDEHLNTSPRLFAGFTLSGSSSTTTLRSTPRRSTCNSRIPMRASTSGRPATISIRSMDAGRRTSPHFTIPPTRTSCCCR
jgi:hypothetical protein